MSEANKTADPAPVQSMVIRRFDLHDGYGEPFALTLRRGMAWAIYTDHGPTGPCGQSMSTTCPHSVFAVWPDEAAMRADIEKRFRGGQRSNLQYGVIGEWSSGRGAIVCFDG